MIPPKHFLITGGTGRQGGAVVTALITDASSPIPAENIHVITRNKSGLSATRLADRGISLIQGDLNSPAAILKHLDKANVNFANVSVFMAQAHGPTELEDAKGFIDAVAAAGICYFVYSSVDRGGKALSDNDASYCKTFSDKFYIEKHLVAAANHSKEMSNGSSGMDYTILRPTWFADNADWGFPGRLCMTAWRDNMKGKRLQMVTTKDIGRWASEALLRPDSAGIRNDALSIASDELTFDEADRIFKEENDVPVAVTYGWLTKLIVWLTRDLRTMFAWIDERNYGANLAELKQTLEPTTFRSWAKTVKIEK